MTDYKSHERVHPQAGHEEKTITLPGGGTLSLRASVKFFDLPKDARDFVFKIIDELAEYEENAKPKQLAAPVGDAYERAAAEQPLTAPPSTAAP